MQRAVGTVLVAVLVVLAGCSGVFGGDGGGDDVETVTPAPVPTDEPTPTPVPQLAPGLTEQGIENASALVAAHGSFLRNQSFTQISNSTALASNGSVLLRTTSTLRAGPPGEGVYSVTDRNESYSSRESIALPIHSEGWWDGQRYFVKRTFQNGTTTYNRPRIDVKQFRYNIAQGGLSYRLKPFGTANTSVTDRFTRNGTTLYRVRGVIQSDTAGNLSLRLLIDSRGVIHRYTTVRRLPSEMNISKSITKTRFVTINETDAPERPSWVDEAMNRTTATWPTETTRSGQ
jgi:hypothetical protein